MVSNNQLKHVIQSQRDVFLGKSDLFKRHIIDDIAAKYDSLKEIIVLTGVRRAGKSSLMRLIWDTVKQEQQLSDNQFLYINFEDERLIDIQPADLQRLLDAYFELFPPQKNKRVYLFFDEIQRVPAWERWLHRIYEDSRYKIYVTGSNSSLLASELSTALTGRHLALTIFPLSFYEYCAYWHGRDITAASFYDEKQQADLKNLWSKYYHSGGFPEFIRTGAVELLQEYWRDIVLRDIVNRYNIRHKKELQELAQFLVSNIAQLHSLQSLKNVTANSNLTTIKHYLTYLEESFLLFAMPRFSFSYKQQVYNPDKIFTVDVGFFHHVGFKISPTIGPIYENIVFLACKKKRNNEVFYYQTKNNLEVDFIVKRREQVKEVIQVSYNVEDPATMAREERALVTALQELNLPEGLIINDSVTQEKTVDGKVLRYIPIWRWLLEPFV